MVDFGNRLKEERKRLGLNQSEIAEHGGVSLQAQFRYEKGERMPDAAYLAGIAKAGADIQYIITGIRAGQAEPLTQEEAALLENFRDLSETGKKAVKATTDALSQAKGDQANVA